MPHERIPRAVQGVAAGRPNRHDRRQDGRIQSLSRHAREELPVNCNGAHLRVVTAEVDSVGTDSRLNAGRWVRGTGGPLSEGDKGLRAEAEPGESEPTYRKAIARDIVPLGVRLQRCLARLHARRRWRGRLLRDGGRGCAESENDEKARRDTERAN